MIVCKELNKSYESKELLFKDLQTNKQEILDFKKAQILKSCDKDIATNFKPVLLSKSLEQIKSFEVDNDYYYIAVNSTNVLDSHSDLHVNGIWNKTVKEQQGKNYLVCDHKLEVDKVIAKSKDVEMFTAEVPFSTIGKDYNGTTEVLIYKVAKDKIINTLIKEWLDSGDEIQASVRMQYVNIEMALNSTDKSDVNEKKVYDEYIDKIANKSEFDSIDYFFVVKDAKNVRESSLVLFGSNNATGLIQENKEEAELITSEIKNEPTEVTQTIKRKLSII
jgi:hypothetical protein